MSGVGTEIKKLIPKWVKNNNASCRCNRTGDKWDRAGINWCENNKQLLSAHLMGQSEVLKSVLNLVPKAMQRAAVSIIINKAIENAKKALALKEEDAKIRKDDSTH